MAPSGPDAVEREALARNEAPYVLSYFSPGDGKKTRPLTVLSDRAVVITALKKAEASADLIVRLFEPTGRRRTTTLSLPYAGAEIRISLGPFEIKTLAFNRKTRRFKETDLLERPIRKT